MHVPQFFATGLALWLARVAVTAAVIAVVRFCALYLLDWRAELRVPRRQDDTGAAFRRTAVFDIGADWQTAFVSARDALVESLPVTAVDADEVRGLLTAEVAGVWKDWGDVVTVRLVVTTRGERRVEIASQPANARTVFDLGKNRRNVRAVSVRLRELLMSPTG